MDSNSQQAAGGSSPAKPWERAGAASSGPTPFKPPSPGSTSTVVEASGTAKPGEIVSASDRNTTVSTNTLARPVPTRPWEQQTYGNTYGGYGSSLSYNSPYGSGMYGSSYGGLGSYGGGLYGNNFNTGGYGGMYGGGMHGGGMYNSSIGGPFGGYGMGPHGVQDPNNPYGAPPSPPGFWISFLRVMQGVVNVFGRISFLVDQNTQAVHMFMSALLQLFDRGGLLYGELARFVLRLLGIKTKPGRVQGSGPEGLPVPQNPHGHQQHIEGPKAAPSGGWDNAWGESTSK